MRNSRARTPKPEFLAIGRRRAHFCFAQPDGLTVRSWRRCAGSDRRVARFVIVSASARICSARARYPGVDRAPSLIPSPFVPCTYLFPITGKPQVRKLPSAPASDHLSQRVRFGSWSCGNVPAGRYLEGHRKAGCARLFFRFGSNFQLEEVLRRALAVLVSLCGAEAH